MRKSLKLQNKLFRCEISFRPFQDGERVGYLEIFLPNGITFYTKYTETEVEVFAWHTDVNVKGHIGPFIYDYTKSTTDQPKHIVNSFDEWFVHLCKLRSLNV